MLKRSSASRGAPSTAQGAARAGGEPLRHAAAARPPKPTHDPRAAREAPRRRHPDLPRPCPAAHLGFVEPLSEPVHHPRGRCPAAAARSAPPAGCGHGGCRLPARRAGCSGSGASSAARREAPRGGGSQRHPNEGCAPPLQRTDRPPAQTAQTAPTAPRLSARPQNIARPPAQQRRPLAARRMRRGRSTRSLSTAHRPRNQSEGGWVRPPEGSPAYLAPYLRNTRRGRGTTSPSMPHEAAGGAMRSAAAQWMPGFVVFSPGSMLSVSRSGRRASARYSYPYLSA